MKSQFKSLRFKTVGDLSEWLRKNTYKVIHLEDKGQDMQKIWVHKTGEILDSDFHSSIYCGKFIDVKRLNTGKPLFICDDGGDEFNQFDGLIVEKIVKLD